MPNCAPSLSFTYAPITPNAQPHPPYPKKIQKKQVRYVLDFYAGQIDPQNPKPVAMHLDVRPALDSFDVRACIRASARVSGCVWLCV